MGWNEARINIVPDRWDFTVRETTATSTAGENVLLVGTEKNSESSEPMLTFGTADRWLTELGFVLRESWKTRASYSRHDILIDLYQEDDEISGIMVQFTLTKESPRHWQEWQEFIDKLCADLPVALGDAELRMKVGPEQLFPVLRRTTAWKTFEENFQWPSPTA